MKKIFFISVAITGTLIGTAQNVGIGTTNPLMKLHVAKEDSAVALLENTQPLNTNVKTALYFKTGTGPHPYTGAIKTTGEGIDAARLGLFSYTSTSPNQLLERLSITDIGNVGIGTITPTAKLEVNGSAIITGDVTVNGNVKMDAGVSFPIKVVTSNTYSILPSDYTIVLDMQQDTTKSMQVYLPATSVIGRVLKIVTINMEEKFGNPNIAYPFKGTVSIYDIGQNLNTRLQALSFYLLKEIRTSSTTVYAYNDFQKTTACSLQYSGPTLGWIVTDLKSEKFSGVNYIY